MALKTSAAITIISILYNLPRFWISRGYPGVVQVGIYYSTVYHSNFFRFYETWLDFFIIYAIPLAVITICNTSICIKLKVFSSRRKRMASHQDLSAHQERDNRLTRMLIYVVIEFLICSFIHLTQIIHDE
ncbi:hypothetical protein GE061_018455 [Apolygus lucorum]|uniref:G-protein coupled receptors family 1 profile domain-containing protein n=1 Tax=Apolygus lucorum TaxID=248454 RepID=A0A8S9XI04_APOLU|nr:hypothetical protein GE061_018455 [Apolygus lucorum]